MRRHEASADRITEPADEIGRAGVAVFEITPAQPAWQRFFVVKRRSDSG